MPEVCVYGIHAAQQLLETDPARAIRLLSGGRDDRRTARLKALAEAAGVACVEMSRQELDRLCAGAVHQGVVLEVRPSTPWDEHRLTDYLDRLTVDPLLLVLDGVTDPRNLGACLRSADGAGAHAVVCPKDRAVGLTPAVRKVACGAAETVPLVVVGNLARALRMLRKRGIWLAGTDASAGQSVWEADLRGPLGLVLGGEERGLRRLTREHCDLLMALPMRGMLASLNVAVAAGVCLYEAVRQRR